jgi:hypothetical protein
MGRIRIELQFDRHRNGRIPRSRERHHVVVCVERLNEIFELTSHPANVETRHLDTVSLFHFRHLERLPKFRTKGSILQNDLRRRNTLG